MMTRLVLSCLLLLGFCLCAEAQPPPVPPTITSVMTNVIAPTTGTYQPSQQIDAVAGHGFQFDTTAQGCWPSHNYKIEWKHTVSWAQSSSATAIDAGATEMAGPTCVKYTRENPIQKGRWDIPATPGPIYYTFTATTKAQVSSHTYPPMHPQAPGPEIWSSWQEGAPAGSQLNIPEE